MTKGCKIWLWFIFIVNILSAVASIAAILVAPFEAICTIVLELILIYGIYLLLFKQQKKGYTFMIAAIIITFGFNVVNGVSIVTALLSAILCPAITYYFLTKNADVFQ